MHLCLLTPPCVAVDKTSLSSSKYIQDYQSPSMPKPTFGNERSCHIRLALINSFPCMSRLGLPVFSISPILYFPRNNKIHNTATTPISILFLSNLHLHGIDISTIPITNRPYTSCPIFCPLQLVWITIGLEPWVRQRLLGCVSVLNAV